MVESGALKVGARFTDGGGPDGVEADVQRVAAGHAGPGPAVRHGPNAGLVRAHGEQPAGLPSRAETRACVHTLAPEQNGFTPDRRQPPGTLRAARE
ncbi:hypothetical protein GCM10025734_04070 [Kitasatospora paranensis]